MDFALFFGQEKTLLYKKGQGVVFNEPTVTPDINAAAPFLRSAFKKVGAIGADILVCIPASLSSFALNDYKTALFSAGASDASFISSALAAACDQGYNPDLAPKAISIVTEGSYADLVVIDNGEIVDGGTLTSPEKFALARAEITKRHPRIPIYVGDRISIVTGAGKLLSAPKVLKALIDLN